MSLDQILNIIMVCQAVLILVSFALIICTASVAIKLERELAILRRQLNAPINELG